MRKVMLLAAMLAMVLAAAAPALAQQIGGDQGPVAGDDAVQAGDNTQFAAVCQNIIGEINAGAVQYATSEAEATADENAAAVSQIAQEQNISVSQVNKCLNVHFASASVATHSASGSASAGGGGGGGGGTATATATSTATASASATALPATGGPVPSSALALGAGALLVGGGLLARKIVR